MSVLPGGNVGLRVTGRPGPGAVAGFSGLSTCGSVWACPVDAAKVARKRAEEVSTSLLWARSVGHTPVLATFTLSHDRSHPLRSSWDAACTAWNQITGGPRWQKICGTVEWGPRASVWDRSLPRPLGWIRIIECTHGEENGWHPHLHVILVLEGQVSQERAQELANEMFDRWAKGLAKKGYHASREHGVDVQVTPQAVDDKLAEYFTKQMSMEATHGHLKKGRKGGLAPFGIRAAWRETGDVALRNRWYEWEQASHGRRQMTWSTGDMDLRKMAGLGQEETDEEIAAAEEIEDEDVVQLPAETWRAIRLIAWQLLDVAELEGAVGAARWLRVRGLGFGVITVRGLAPP